MPGSFYFKFEGNVELIEKFLAAPQKVMSTVAVALDQMMQLVAFRAKANLSGNILKTRTGGLRDSIHATKTDIEGDVKVFASVESDEEHSKYGLLHEETGSRAHKIFPSNAQALHFFWEKIGEEAYLKSVNHPGFPARPFLTPALMETIPEIESAIEVALLEAFNE
jgi:hypothetical protein